MPPSTQATDPLDGLMKRAKKLAQEYRKHTGRPLGITGEVAEYEACRLLGLCMAPVRQAGYDALRGQGKKAKKIQVKGRVVLPTSKPGQRVGGIRFTHEWDSVVLDIMDEDLEALVIYEADRDAITAALTAPGSAARTKRGQLGVSKFKSIGRVVWSRP